MRTIKRWTITKYDMCGQQYATSWHTTREAARRSLWGDHTAMGFLLKGPDGIHETWEWHWNEDTERGKWALIGNPPAALFGSAQPCAAPPTPLSDVT